MSKITISWAPNVQKDDLLLAVSLLFQPWRWSGNNAVKRLERKFSDYIGQECVAFDSARSSLYALLKAYGIGENDEVALQAFTCVALPNPILWAGVTPIYIDVDKENYNLDLDDLEKKLTPKTKAVIVQYTFGISPDIQRLKNICDSHGILLIEDCCHSLGMEINIKGKAYKAGTIGEAAIYSFGMEKVISGTRGGVATSKNSEVLEKLNKFQQDIKRPRFREILRGLLNPITWKLYENWGTLGKFFMKLMVKMKLHEFGLTKLELVGKKAPWLPYQMPNTNAILTLNQFDKLNLLNQHRKEIAQLYYEKIGNKLLDLNYVNKFAQAIWLRIPMVVEDSEKFLIIAEQAGLYLGNWYTEVIHCKDVDLNAMKYHKGSCPNAEWLSTHTINLPTHIDIDKVEINMITQFCENVNQ